MADLVEDVRSYLDLGINLVRVASLRYPERIFYGSNPKQVIVCSIFKANRDIYSHGPDFQAK